MDQSNSRAPEFPAADFLPARIERLRRLRAKAEQLFSETISRGALQTSYDRKLQENFIG
jgi:hypothetical protein